MSVRPKNFAIVPIPAATNKHNATKVSVDCVCATSANNRCKTNDATYIIAPKPKVALTVRICWNDLDGITWKKAVVASAGYTGTAFWGCILLLFRRTVLGPTIGTITLGVAIVLTCVLFVRNTFGFVVLFIEGLTLILCGWLLPAVWLDNLFAFLAANCSMNALLDIRNLYGSAQNYNGDTLMNTDAQAVAEYWGGDYRLWATFWLVFAVVATLIGLMFARDARALPTSKTDLAGGQSVHDQEGKPPTGDVSSAKLNAERHYWAQPL